MLHGLFMMIMVFDIVHIFKSFYMKTLSELLRMMVMMKTVIRKYNMRSLLDYLIFIGNLLE